MGSSKKKILIISPIHRSLLKKLKKLGYKIYFNPLIKYNSLKNKVSDANLIILRSGINLDKNIIKKAKQLKYIIRAGVGLDNIDLKFAKKKGIKVFNTPNISARSVAEFSFGLMLSVARNIVKADRQIRKNIWKKHELYGFELKHKTLGIIGLGKIGSEIAKIARGFSLKVVANIKNKKKKRNLKVELVSLNKLLKESDFISLNVPLTDSTKNLINKKNSKFLKSNCILLNLSRGGVIDENLLYKLLIKRKIFGAATDVFLHEKKRSKLFKLSNIVVTPHIGAMSYDAQQRIASEVYQKILDLH